MTIRCQKGSDNNYRTKPTSARALVKNGMNFKLLFATKVIPPSRWVNSGRCKCGLGKDAQSIPSTTQQRYYNICNLPPETFFRGQEDHCWPTQPASTTNLPQLGVNIYYIFLFQMGGNLECIRFCIYDRVVAYGLIETSLLPLFFSLPALSLKPNPLFFV